MCSCWPLKGTRGGHGSQVPESAPTWFIFGLGSEAGIKICGKLDPDPELLFIFGSSRSLRGFYKCHCLSTSLNFRLIHGFRSLDRSRILKSEKISGPGAQSRFLKMWFRPPLEGTDRKTWISNLNKVSWWSHTFRNSQFFNHICYLRRSGQGVSTAKLSCFRRQNRLSSSKLSNHYESVV